MRDDGLYERLTASEQCRRVAAILLDTQRDVLREHADKDSAVSTEVELGHIGTVLAALAGDFDYVRSATSDCVDVMNRINVILSPLCDSCKRGRCQEQGCDVVNSQGSVCPCKCESA